MKCAMTWLILLALNVQTLFGASETHHHPHSPEEITPTPAREPSPCSEMEFFEISRGMCQTLPMADMPMSMLMIHGNGFFTGISQTGPRGRQAVTLTDMIMIDLGTSLGDSQYVSIELMGTTERWTVPEQGYPLLMQIGEENAAGKPYLDAQHPHSSPLMGLTFSDTIRLGLGKNHLKIFFAPRGETTDGPIAFMHRPTGMVNPDAPLGHHIGQDVGHVSSTVFGQSLKIGTTWFEASIFNGQEPSPTKIDLPLGSPDSYSLRLIQEFSQQCFAMASFAQIKNSASHNAEHAYTQRYSGSIYNKFILKNGWVFDHALIYGGITNFDHAAFLHSFAEEYLLNFGRPRSWGRIEVLQRTPAELAISTDDNVNTGTWVNALTAGSSYVLVKGDETELSLGGSVTHSIMPQEFKASYGGSPWSGKVFLQIGTMKMWAFQGHSP